VQPQDPNHRSRAKPRTKVFASIRNFFERFVGAFAALNYQYESKHRFLGLPLLSIDIGFDTKQQMRHARGWTAIGTRATGLFAFGFFMARGLFAVGALAIGIGTVSLASIGLITVSVFGVGFVSVSVFAFGYLAVGILAIGYKSVGIIAIGREVVGIIGVGTQVDSLFSP